MIYYGTTTLNETIKDSRRLRSIMRNMEKPKEFTYLDFVTLDRLLSTLEEYIKTDIEEHKRKEVIENDD